MIVALESMAIRDHCHSAKVMEEMYATMKESQSRDDAAKAMASHYWLLNTMAGAYLDSHQKYGENIARSLTMKAGFTALVEEEKRNLKAIYELTKKRLMDLDPDNAKRLK